MTLLLNGYQILTKRQGSAVTKNLMMSHVCLWNIF